MNIESLKEELQNHIDTFKVKWMPKLENEYGGDAYKLYRENTQELLDDIAPIWELCFIIDQQDKVSNFVTIKDLGNILKE